MKRHIRHIHHAIRHIRRTRIRTIHAGSIGGLIVLALTLTIGLQIRAQLAHRTFRRVPFTNRYTAALPASGISTSLQTSADALTLAVSRGTSTVSFALPVEKAKAKQTGQAIIYDTADPNVHIRYQLLPDGIKEEIILDKRPERTLFTSTMSLSQVVPRVSDTGQIVFVNPAGAYEFHIQQPFARDANGAVTHGVRYRLLGYNNTNRNASKDNKKLGLQTFDLLGPLPPHNVMTTADSYTLALDLDPVWLNDPKRTYPVVIDPTVVHDTSAEFATGQLNRVKDTGSGSAPYLETYYQGDTNDEHTMMLLHLDETSNGTCTGTKDACDSSGNGNHGTVTGTTIDTSTQKVGAASRTFNGTTDYIEVADSTTTRIGTPDFTFMAWLNPSSLASCGADGAPTCIIANKENSYEFGISSTGLLAIAIRNGYPSWAWVNLGVTLPASTWSHIAIVYDSTNVYAYLNGELISTNESIGPINNTTYQNALRIGARGAPGAASAFFAGKMDDISLSDIARSPKEIKEAANRRPYSVFTSDVIDFTTNATAWNSLSWTELGVTTGDGETLKDSTSLIAQWNLNETSGTTAAVSAGSCSTSCNGTLSGFDSTASQDAVATSTWTANYRRWGAGALMFDGVDSNISVPDNDLLSFGTAGTDTAFSMSAWIMPRSVAGTSDGNWIINKRNATASDEWQFLIWQGQLDMALYSGNGNVIAQLSYETFTPGKWYFVTATYDGSKTAAGIKLYINGKLAPTYASTAGSYVGMSNSTLPVTIGQAGWSTAYNFDGVIDSLTVYGRAQTASEILSNYNAGNIELQTRVGADTSPDDGSWEAWKPATAETAVDSFDNADEIGAGVYRYPLADVMTNQTWHKRNNAIPTASNTTGTDGRIPVGTSGGDTGGILHASVIKDGSTYKMWYSGFDATNWRVYYATSPDGLTWTKYDNTVPTASNTTGTNGRIPLGTSGGDTTHIQYRAVIKDGSTYKMWYSGHDGTNWRCYYATSSDGLTWTKYDNTVPAASNTTGTNGRIPLGTSGGDTNGVLCTNVIKDGSTYKMWYSGNDGTNWRTYYATSPDGLTWTKYNNTVPTASDSVGTLGRLPLGSTGADTSHAYLGSVIKDGDMYKMWYGMNNANVRTGYATSTDGLTWYKQNNAVPSASDTTGTDGRVPLGTTGTGDVNHVYTPIVIKDGSTYKMWYTGYDVSAVWRIYYASMTPVPIGLDLDSVIKQEGSYSQRWTTGSLGIDASTVALYHLNETGGTANYYKDSSGNGHHGTPSNTTVADGISGKAASFNGTSSNIVIPADTAFDFTGDYTLEAWVRPNALPGTIQGIMGKVSDNGWGLNLYSTNKFNFGSHSCSNFDGTTTPVIGQWYYVVGVFQSSGDELLYVNGKLDAVGTLTGGNCGSDTSNVVIGQYRTTSTYNFNGVIDEVRISNTARSAEEIAENYRLGRDHYINRTISSTDLSAKQSLPFYIAADRPGTYLEATVGESAYANWQPDTDTVGLWHLDEPDNHLTYDLTGSTIRTGDWTEIDPNANKISQSDGIVLSAGTVAAWDSAMVTNSTFTRAGGLKIHGTFTTGASVAAPNHMMVGFATNSVAAPSYTNLNHALYWNAGTFYVYQDGALTGGPYGSGYTTSTKYEFEITLNAAGTQAAYSVKGGAYTNWTTLLAADTAKSNTPVRVQIAQYQHTGTFNELSIYTPVTVRDASSAGNDGITTGTKQANGVIGLGKSFQSGSRDYIKIPASAALDVQAFTIDAWMYSSDFNQNGFIFEKTTNGVVNTQYSCFLQVTTGIVFRTYNSVSTGNDLTVTQAVAGLTNNAWNHIACVYDGSAKKIYVNGVLIASAAYSQTLITNSAGTSIIGAYGSGDGYFFNGILDEVRVSNTGHSAEDIRQEYEVGRRSHPVTIDFGAKLDSGNLITGPSDTGFTIDATTYGASQKGSNLYKGDKIIIKENYDGTEYTAQGTVTAVTPSTGAVTVAAWDSGSTFHGSGYTANADVFKWQREYWDITGPMDSHINAVTNLTLRTTDGSVGRTIWLDDLKSAGDYLTTSAGSTITSSTGYRYFQYRIINHSSDEAVSPQLTTATVDYTVNTAPAAPSLDFPTNTAVGQSTTPKLRTTTTDADSDYLKYKIQLCTDLAMTQNCQTFDQTSSQTGWSGQDAQSSTAYASGTQGAYTVQTALTANTTYYWRSYAIDPGGTNTWSSTQGTPYSFTTIASNASGYIDTVTGSTDATISVSTGSLVTAFTNQLYVAAISEKNNRTVSTVTGMGLTWTLAQAQCGGRAQARTEVWYAIGTPTDDGTVTATFSIAPEEAVIAVSRYAKVSTASPIGNKTSANSVGVNDVTCTGGNDASSYSVNLTTTVNGSYAYGAVSLRQYTHTPGVNYTERAEVSSPNTPSGSGSGVAVEDYLVTTASTVAVDGSFSSTNDYAVVALEIKPNTAPNTPSLDLPTDAVTNQSLLPVLKTTTTDTDSDYLRYKIQLCTDLAMTQSCQTFDQTSSQTGWSGQNTQSSTAYTSGTQGVYTVQTALSSGTTYYWRSYAIDPGGSNTWSSTQGTPYSFTTSTAAIPIKFNGLQMGGVNVN